MEYHYAYYNYKEIQDIISRDPIVILSVGSIEQHCNGPVGADYLISEKISRELCKTLLEKNITCMLLPPIAYGFSPEWSKCPGTISLALETYVNLIKDILENLIKTGFKNIVVLNAHGGNSSLIEATIRELNTERIDDDFKILLLDYWRPLGVSLGHCDKIEEALLSEILNMRIECNCSRYDIIDKTIKKVDFPRDPCDYGLKNTAEESLDIIKIEKIVEVLVEKILDFYNMEDKEIG